MVTNGTSVRSRSGSRGVAAASAAARSTAVGELGGHLHLGLDGGDPVAQRLGGDGVVAGADSDHAVAGHAQHPSQGVSDPRPLPLPAC